MTTFPSADGSSSGLPSTINTSAYLPVSIVPSSSSWAEVNGGVQRHRLDDFPGRQTDVQVCIHFHAHPNRCRTSRVVGPETHQDVPAPQRPDVRHERLVLFSHFRVVTRVSRTHASHRRGHDNAAFHDRVEEACALHQAEPRWMDQSGDTGFDRFDRAFDGLVVGVDRKAVHRRLLDHGVQDFARHGLSQMFVDHLDPVDSAFGQKIDRLTGSLRRIEVHHAVFPAVGVVHTDRAARMSVGWRQNQAHGEHARSSEFSGRDTRAHFSDRGPEVAVVVDRGRTRSQERIEPAGQAFFDVPRQGLVAGVGTRRYQVDMGVHEPRQDRVRGSRQVDRFGRIDVRWARRHILNPAVRD